MKKGLTAFSKRHKSMQPGSSTRRGTFSSSTRNVEPNELDTETVEKLNLFGRPTYTKN